MIQKKDVKITDNILDINKNILLKELKKTKANLIAYNFSRLCSSLYLIGEDSLIIKKVVDNIKTDYVYYPSFSIFMSYVLLMCATCGFHVSLKLSYEEEKEKYLELKNELL